MLLQSMKQPKMVGYYFIFSIVFGTVSLQQYDLDYVRTVLARFDFKYKPMWWLRQTADWEYSTNVTSDTIAKKDYIEEAFSDLMKRWKVWARKHNREDYPFVIKDFLDMLSSGIIIMNAEDASMISDLKSKMIDIYSSANISLPKLGIMAQGESEYGSLMGKIHDPAILLQLWKSWRIQVGEKTRPLFLNLIKLINKAARENGYDNVGSYWQRELGSDDMVDTALLLWEEVKPLYAHLHAYVQHKLKQTYRENYFSSAGFIPAHLLGSLWGENWVALSDILTPYPDQPVLNLTENFQLENYTMYDLLEKAEEFYVRAGLEPMKESLWQKSMFIKPKDGRIVDCHAASYDFALNDDYRIRMCGKVKERSFFEAVHEMGHIQYYMAYRNLPMVYRNGANSAFHEAVGETMVYAVQNPQCLQLLNIVQTSEISRETLINNLMKQALSKIVLLPWALTVETWRYSLLAGDITEEDMTEKWWRLRESFQGIEPPDEDSREMFDAGTKYHIINNIPYMRYFIGRFLEHQFLEALCGILNEDVHTCCLMKDENAGKKLLHMLRLGSAVSWQVALEVLTGKQELSARPLIKYYEPLYLWLVDYNRHHNITTSL